MDPPRYHISPYIIIPVVFAGFATIAVVVSFRITEYCIAHGIGTTWWISAWAVLISLASFFCSLFILRLILRPVEKFIKKAEELPIISSSSKSSLSAGNDLQQFSKVFSRVADSLNKVQARQFFPEIIGESRAMRSIFSQILKVAPTESIVLIYGENGTGRDLVARSIHSHSERMQKPFVRLNCVASSEDFLERELFGDETGDQSEHGPYKKGKLEIADGGTLFLGEIGEMPLQSQAKVLRVLQEKEFNRRGGNKAIGCDVRFIASSSKDLEQLVLDGTFREDLFAILNAFSIILPPLREKKEDIPMLVDYFLQKHRKESGDVGQHEEIHVSSEALQALMVYSWGGNVRELQNIVERAAVMCEKSSIDIAHLPVNIKNNTPHLPQKKEGELISIDDQLQEIEKGFIVDALIKAGGIQVKSAGLLGINQRSLWHRIKKHQIDVRAFKNSKM